MPMRLVNLIRLIGGLSFSVSTASAQNIAVEPMGGSVGFTGWNFAGQTFTAPLGVTKLESFSLYLSPISTISGGDESAASVALRFSEFQNGDEVGTSLVSERVDLTAESVDEPFRWYDFFPNFTVVPGRQYRVTILPYTADDEYGTFTTYRAYTAGGDAYSGGSAGLVYLLQPGWQANQDGSDLAFRATFLVDPVVVPEPASFSLLLLGGFGISMAARLRRRRA